MTFAGLRPKVSPPISAQMKGTNDQESHWLGKLANLNAARTKARGIAPHKPLMLLTVIDLIELGNVIDGWVKYDVHLVSRFRDYWELVIERQRNQPDDPRNGLALTPDAHWMFDQGLWTAVPRGDRFFICVAKDRFKESSPYGQTLVAFDQKVLHFHEQANIRPEAKYFAWHHKKHRFDNLSRAETQLNGH